MIFLRKDITVTRNRVILFCIQKPTALPICVNFWNYVLFILGTMSICIKLCNLK